MLSTISSLVNIVGTAATTGMEIYGAVSAQDLAERKFELEEDIARQKAAMDQMLFDSQKSLVDIQAEGIQRTQDITLSVQEAEAELRRLQIERERRLTEAQISLEQQKLQADQQRAVETQAGTVVVQAPVSKANYAYIAAGAVGLAAVYFLARKK